MPPQASWPSSTGSVSATKSPIPLPTKTSEQQDFGPTFPQHLDGEFALGLVDRPFGRHQRGKAGCRAVCQVKSVASDCSVGLDGRTVISQDWGCLRLVFKSWILSHVFVFVVSCGANGLMMRGKFSRQIHWALASTWVYGYPQTEGLIRHGSFFVWGGGGGGGGSLAVSSDL